MTKDQSKILEWTKIFSSINGARKTAQPQKKKQTRLLSHNVQKNHLKIKT